MAKDQEQSLSCAIEKEKKEWQDDRSHENSVKVLTIVDVAWTTITNKMLITYGHRFLPNPMSEKCNI